MPPAQACLFDLDGTLVHSAPDLAAAANRMRDRFGLPELPVERIATFVGKGIPMLVRRALADDLRGDVDESLFRQALPLYEQFYAEESGRLTTVYPGVVPGLELLRAHGVRLGVVTNKAARFTDDLLAQLGLAPWFDVVVSGDTVATRKPDPGPLLHAFERLAASPERAIFVGDSANDVAAARAAGCPVWCVSYGYREGESVESLQADCIVDDVATAARLVVTGVR
jgi:phosphoglycolate phosphatase